MPIPMSYHEMRGELGRKLKERRRQCNLSQEDVATLLHVDRVTIGFIEQNRRAPSLSTLHKLSCIYKCELKEFFDFETGAGAAAGQDSAFDQIDLENFTAFEDEGFFADDVVFEGDGAYRGSNYADEKNSAHGSFDAYDDERGV